MKRDPPRLALQPHAGSARDLARLEHAAYPWLFDTEDRPEVAAAKIAVQRRLGVPCRP